jgi:hypothetical protein
MEGISLCLGITRVLTCTLEYKSLSLTRQNPIDISR